MLLSNEEIVKERTQLFLKNWEIQNKTGKNTIIPKKLGNSKLNSVD
jgi:hypothetical protein